MGLHDRLTRQGENGAAVAVATNGHGPVTQPTVDPYAELKTRIHHACIARLGPELFAADNSSGDLADRVLRAVMEQLALDRTPLTREERRKLVREIADDILGYGPLEPYLRDTAVTEVMVNGPNQVYVERAGKLEMTNT